MNAVAVVAVAVAAAAAAAPGFPSFDVDYERVLIGGAPVPGALGRTDVAPVVHGTFVAKDGVLRLASPAAYGESTWLADADSGSIDDGVARMRVGGGAGGVE